VALRALKTPSYPMPSAADAGAAKRHACIAINVVTVFAMS
jgi:hypothetical protein